MVERPLSPADPPQLAETVERLRNEMEAAHERLEKERGRRRRVERELRDAEAVYHSLVENLPISLIRKDCELRLIFANRPVCEEYGQPLSELRGKTDFDFFPDELARKYRADDRRVMETGEVFEDIEAHRTPEGEWQYAHVIKAPVVDSDGQIVGVQAVFWDETDRKRAEEELKASEARKRAIFETSLDCLIISDEHGRIVEFNRAAEQTFGYMREEALGEDMDELLFHPSTWRDGRTRFPQLSVIGEEGSLLGKRLEVPLVRRNGEEFIAEMAMQPIPLEGTVHFATVLHDITNRKQNEADLQKAKEDAEAASRAKSAFLANMSHEIRTPMNAILGMTGLVLDTELTPEQRAHLLIVQDSTESLLSLINDILDFSKIEAGRLDMHLEPFALRERIGDTMKSLNVRARDKRLHLAFHVAPDVPEFLVGDVGRLRQVVINLVGNAVKFTDEGEVRLEINVASRTATSCELHFVVRDTGIGIPVDRQSRIFEVFEQVDSSTTRRFGGTGLGLAISTRLVELMGGRIWVDSDVGRGSTFHFTAAFGVADGEFSRDRAAAVQTLRGISVLLVDHNLTSLRNLQQMLTTWDMAPLVATSVPEALDCLHQAASAGRPIQLLLIDAGLPGGGAAEVIHHVRQSPNGQETAVLVLTSVGRASDVDRCPPPDACRCVTKPVKQSELLDAIGASFDVSPVLRGDSRPMAGEAPHVRGLKILLAEDSIPNQKLAIGLLRKFDHQVVVASDGLAALDLWKSQPFDLILMDVQMPHMDGLEATRLIRKREQASGLHIPMIAMTAHAMRGDEERCLEAGLDAYVAKPIRPDDLFRAIDDVCRDAFERKRKHESVHPSRPLVDWNSALQVVQGDRELLTEVVGAVLEEVPRLLRELEQAIDAGDARSIQRLAHTIKGNMRTFHA
ncbi:MAG: response regulator, partial [Planctomycetaceae bacterium]|nr:response regulator [Planctomycetaceae bacterium]